MSQAVAEGQAETESSDETDLASALLKELSAMNEILESFDEDHFSDMSDEELAKVWSEVKDLEKNVKGTRKDQVEEVLEERVDPGERLCGINHIESHNKFVSEDVSNVIMRAVSRGIDYTQFVSLDASTIADMNEDLDKDLAEIGRSEYTYFR